MLTEGKPFSSFLTKEEERVFKFFVPEDASIDHVNIHAIATDAFKSFELLVGYNNTLPDSKHSYVRPAWTNGYEARFDKTMNCCFCTGCNYTAIIKATDPGLYLITAKTSISVQQLRGEPVYDLVNAHGKSCYKYNVPQSKHDLRVRLTSYSGDADVYVNPYPMPT